MMLLEPEKLLNIYAIYFWPFAAFKQIFFEFCAIVVTTPPKQTNKQRAPEK